jgi:hypothetical protein
VSTPELCQPRSRVRHRATILAAAVLVGGAAGPAGATLGEGMASIHQNQMRAAGVRRQSVQLDVQVHTIAMADGSTIRQYVGPGGQVFAVAWNTRFKPRLDELLGPHFAAYADASRRAMSQRPGVRHSLRVQQGDLVVESMAHLNTHVGRAYLRSQLPAGTSADAIR